MEKKCLWLEFEQMKRDLALLKTEKKRCRDEMETAKQDNVIPLEEALEKAKLRLGRVKEEYE